VMSDHYDHFADGMPEAADEHERDRKQEGEEKLKKSKLPWYITWTCPDCAGTVNTCSCG